jgi:tetratricopeptide (TPR) repeat protein
MLRISYLSTIAIALFLVPQPYLCRAEKIYYQDGRVIEGQVSSRSRDALFVKITKAGKEETLSLELKEVSRIEDDNGSISKYDYGLLLKEARNCLRQGLYDEAAGLYGKLLASFSENKNLRYLHAILSHKIGELDKAEEDYEFLIAQDSADAVIFNNLATIYAQQKNYARAIEMLNQAARQDPLLKASFDNLAKLSFETRDYQRAIDEYNQLVATEPDNAQALYYLGIAYTLKGDYNHAEGQFKKVKALEPNYAHLQSWLAVLETRD